MLLLGVEDSGTTAIESIFKSNPFYENVRLVSSSVDNGGTFGESGRTPRVWKHIHPELLLMHGHHACEGCHSHSLQELYGSHKIHAVLIVHRNPLQQLLAWRENSNRTFRPVSHCFRDLVQHTWRQKHNCIPMTQWSKRGMAPHGCCQSGPQRSHTDLMELWNSYQVGYLKLHQQLKKLGMPVLLLSYDELVLDPQRTFAKVAVPLNVQPRSNHSFPVCKHCQEVVREKAYLQRLKQEELKFICARLNQTVLVLFGYADCLEVNNASRTRSR